MVNRFNCRRVLVTIFTILIASLPTLGWGGPSHTAMATKLLDDPVISPLIPAGCNVSTVKNFGGEPPDAWHHPCWSMISARGYLTNFQGDNWPGLDQTTRVKYLIHMAADCGVPINHSPARSVYCKGYGLEEAIEAQVATWSTYPTITGTSGYSRNGYSTTFNGTYAEVVNKFYHACRHNASWFKSKEKSFLGIPYHKSEDKTSAGWSGTTLGMYLGRAMLADLFLAERPTIANANGSYAVNPGGSVNFSSAGSYDPDSITWNTAGSYSNNGGGFNCSWDMNNDGTYETAGAAPTLTHAQLVGLVGYTEGKTIRLRAADTEPGVYQSTTTDTATIAVYSNPTADAHGAYSVYEGGSVQFTGTGGDADGGSVSYAWDRDNNGSYETAGQNPTFGYATWAPSETGHTVRVRVTDNETVSATDTAVVRVYSKPTAEANGDYAVYEGGSVQLTSSGSDADGGSVSFAWDKENNGSYETAGQNPTLGYATWSPSEAGHTVQVQVTDNEGQTRTDSAVVRVYSKPTANGRAQYAWIRGLEGSSDFDYLHSDADDADGGSVTTQWDLNNNGTWDATGDGARVVGNDFYNAGMLQPNENHTITMRGLDNEGQTVVQTGIAMAILVDPVANAGVDKSVYQGGSVGLSGSGYDPDGGSITQYRWDIDSDGTWDIYTASASLSYNDLVGAGYGLAPSEVGHTVRFGVVDNDADVGAWNASDEDTMILRILSDPTADALAKYALEPGSSIAFSATGNDADGGGIEEWSWDLDGDGLYDDFSGTGSLTYDQLLSLGLATGEWLAIRLKVVDNDGQVAYDSAELALYPSILGDANGDGMVDISDLGIMATNYGLASGAEWLTGDYNLDGKVDISDLGTLATNYGRVAGGDPLATPEPATMSLLGVGMLTLLRRRRK